MPYPGVHAYLGIVTPAKPAFGNFNRQFSCRERLENIKLNLIYCNCEKKNRPIASQSEKIAFRKLQNELCQTYCNRLPFDKTSLQVNLITQLDMSGLVLVSEINDPSVPSGMSSGNTPYYDYYYFDPYGDLLPKRQCKINQFVNYLVITTVAFTLEPPSNDPNEPDNTPSDPNSG
jgi:hypothetical protein